MVLLAMPPSAWKNVFEIAWRLLALLQPFLDSREQFRCHTLIETPSSRV